MTDVRREAWYIYDRDGELLHVAPTLTGAESWSLRHFGAVEVASRQEITDHDYLCILLAAEADVVPQTYRARDRQVRIMRGDRVLAVARDPYQEPRYP